MLQVRKLVLAVAAATAFTSGVANALGLGGLAVKSSLNQPLEAEISLLEVRDLSSADIKTRLASAEDFTKAGVDRQFFLTGLTFTPVVRADGKHVIRITSNKPVKEPYLNFLVEVLWPNGRLLREYTLLLDPPLYKPQQVIQTAQPAMTAGTTSAQLAAQQARPATQAGAGQAPRVTTPSARKTEYQVKKNDTLWDIAIETKEGSSIHQTMLAIQDGNPSAFLDGNINRLQSGKVLRLPTLEQINKRTLAQATAEVAEQNASWKNKRSTATLAKRQLDATARQEAGAAPQQIEQTDSLRLVTEAPGDSKQASDRGKNNELQSLQDQLASSKERLDSALLENEDLKERVDELDSQLAKLQRLVELKDNLLAQLQDTAGGAAAVDGMDAQQAELDDAAVADASESGDKPTTLEEPPLSDETDAGAPGSDAQLSAAADASDAAADEAQTESGDDTQADAEQAATAAAQTEAEDKSTIDKLLDSPMLLAAAGGGALLALLLALLGLSRRNARQQAASYDQSLNDDLSPEYADDLGSADADDIFQTDAQQQGVGTAAAAPQFKQEVADPLAEANAYMGFARFTQAAEVLHNAIDQEPERLDLQLKLLEVYAELKDQSAFLKQVTLLHDIGAEPEAIERITDTYSHLLVVQKETPASDNLDADLEQLSAQLAEPEHNTQGATEHELDDLEFEITASAVDHDTPVRANLNDDEFVLDAQALDFSSTPEPASNAFELSDEFDFSDLELDEVQSTPAASADTEMHEYVLDDIELSTPAQASTDSVDETIMLDDLDFVPYSDNNTAQLNLARTYIDQGDVQAARDTLNHVMEQGTPEQQAQARDLLEQLV